MPKSAYLCGDRELLGKEWLTDLILDPMLPFRLTIKADHQIHDGRQNRKASIIFADLQQASIRSVLRAALGLGAFG